MALLDWLWLVRLIIEILKLISQLPEDELRMIAGLRNAIDLPDPAAKSKRNPKTT